MISARCRLFAASVTAESRFVLSALLSAAVNTIFVARETSNKKKLVENPFLDGFDEISM